MGAMGWGGVFGRVQGTDLASRDTCYAVYGLGKIVPTYNSLIAKVVDAWLNALVYGSHDGHGQVVGIGRRAYLVKYDP